METEGVGSLPAAATSHTWERPSWILSGLDFSLGHVRGEVALTLHTLSNFLWPQVLLNSTLLSRTNKTHKVYQKAYIRATLRLEPANMPVQKLACRDRFLNQSGRRPQAHRRSTRKLTSAHFTVPRESAGNSQERGNATPVTTPLSQTVPGLSAGLCNASFEESRVVLVVVYSTVCVLGLPANCLTAWLTLLQALQGNVLAVYLFCLALCELLYLSTLPLWVIYIQNEHRWTLGPRACKVTAYIFFCNIYISILLLCCISCDRFLAVVYALESRGRRLQKTAVFISACVFVLVGLVYYPVFDMEIEKESCFEPMRMNEKIAGYHYARFAVGFAIPLCTIAFTNHRIFRSIKLSMGLTAAQKAKVKHSAIAVVVIFLVCFAPYHVVLLIKAATFSYYRGDKVAVCAFEASLYTVSMVFLCLSTVNSVADPIIYVLATDHSRQEVSRIQKGWKKWSAKTEVTKLTHSKDSEEMHFPMALADDCALPPPVNPPGLQPAKWGSAHTPERLVEETC
ncbi:probable G-protein coupled receptor 132 isoform X2 [Marmota marmota marmota]|uniref:probable G-protein coupled receptor 132 isoform X2 n=1 Tax=Marmota marmota marmota TaxID=9994 RepID=UPI002093A7D6|nr:probable G-protein coupled receptor 132 isoform X2 [Marmota marmota marmota]XP_048655437.1 probable G-protein coupled receptor 132 isoform X2 [Marmota marmota marmota]